MPLQISAAHSSRVTKPRVRNPLLKRSTSSPFADHPRRKPFVRSASKPETLQHDFLDEEPDNDSCVVPLTVSVSLHTIPEAIQYTKEMMFDAIPDARSGMNSTRIAEVLNFRRRLPSLVTVGHLGALLDSPTSTEREIARLVKAGMIRKTLVPLLGIGSNETGEAVVLTEDWVSAVNSSRDLEENVKHKYLSLLAKYSAVNLLPRSSFEAGEAQSLMHAGFLTGAGQSGPYSPSSFCNTNFTFRGSLSESSPAGTSHAPSDVPGSSKTDAVDAFSRNLGSHDGEDQGTKSRRRLDRDIGYFQLCLPTTGPYLRLLTAARSHLLFLLSKSKHRQATMDILRERWDGGVAGNDAVSRAKLSRGAFIGILPGRTRKWKQFYGLSFQWVLEECLGAGLVELFNTGSVGLGVRAST
ncbi:MAG: hypothetical protein M1817_001851 [Caeruleum heppii]|nr:MAG: hypothetical protein M1817_001851 [Caeruleum heppii]